MLPETQQLNIEWLFLVLYTFLFGGETAIHYDALAALMAELWIWIIVIGYIFAACSLIMIIYLTLRIFELREREEEFYTTLITDPNAAKGSHPRWEHIQSLLAEQAPSKWREAIIEADIMLDEVLLKEGYSGDGVGDKLKNAHFETLQDAWEAHKVRNQIAHQGSTFDVSQTLAERTIAHYENVFRELGAI
jgi:hypothetical protein